MMRMKRPTVSVIMPVYNGAPWLDVSISSVLAQTYADFEFIIVNDASKDNSPALIERYARQDRRIRFFDNRNQGAGASLDFGIRQARGEYLCFIDQDDFYKPDYISKMVAAIQRNNVDFVLCYAHFYDDATHHEKRVPYRYMTTGEYRVADLDEKVPLFFSFIPQWTKMMRRAFITQYAIQFDERDNKVHDLPFHLGCLYYARVIYVINEVLYCHRIHASQITHNVEVEYGRYYLKTYQELRKRFKARAVHDEAFLPFMLQLFTLFPIQMTRAQKCQAALYHWQDGGKAYWQEKLIRPFYRVKYKRGKKVTRVLFFSFKTKDRRQQNNKMVLPQIPCSNVGKCSYHAGNVMIANPQETIIGSFVSLGSDVQLGCGDHPLDYLSTSPYLYYDVLGYKSNESVSHNEYWNYQPVTIGNDVWIGDRVFIKNGITIGDGAVVGAGSLVTKDVPPYAIVAGVPAKLIRYRFDEKTIWELQNYPWWQLKDEVIRQIPYDDITHAMDFVKAQYESTDNLD